MNPEHQKRGPWYSTAGGRELRLKARPPARLPCNPSLQKHTQSKDKETKTTAPSGNTPFGATNHLQSPFRVTVTFGARGTDVMTVAKLRLRDFIKDKQEEMVPLE